MRHGAHPMSARDHAGRRTDLYDRLVGSAERIPAKRLLAPPNVRTRRGCAWNGDGVRKQTTAPRFPRLCASARSHVARGQRRLVTSLEALNAGCRREHARHQLRAFRRLSIALNAETFGHPVAKKHDAERRVSRRDWPRLIPRANKTDGAAVTIAWYNCGRAHHPAAGNRERAVVRASIDLTTAANGLRF